MSIARRVKGERRNYAIALSITILIFGIIVSAVYPFADIVVGRFSENYAWQARRALRANPGKAVAIAQRRTRDEHYDFKARRLLATAQIADGQSSAAVETLLESLNRMRAVRHRNVYTIGYDPQRDYAMLSKALDENKRFAYAAEMKRMADDQNHLAHPAKFETETSSSAEIRKAVEPAVEKWLDTGLFKLAPGVSRSSDGSLLFTRNSTAQSQNITAHAAQFNDLILEIKGKRVLGIGALAKISCNGEELLRVYANSDQPRRLTVPLPSSVHSRGIQVSAQFLNDEYDSQSQSDRNFELMRLGLR